MSTRLDPGDPFPEDLTQLDLPEVEVLNSKIHRELDFEYARHGGPAAETEFRKDELAEELNRRDADDEEVSVWETTSGAHDPSTSNRPTGLSVGHQ